MPAIHRRWTPEAVRALCDGSRAWPRYELIGGELLVTPAPDTSHQLAVGELLMLLSGYVDAEQLGIVLSSPADLELRAGTITQPDVFVVPVDTELGGDSLQWPDVKRLLLAIEILSPSSVRTDRVEKRDLYLESGVAEYWVVDVEARFVERWLPHRETPEIVRDRLTWTPSGAAPFAIQLPALFDRILSKARLIKAAPGVPGRFA